MLSIHMILAILLTLSIGVAVFWAISNYRRYKKNIAVSAELDSIIRSTLETVQKGKKTTAKVRNSLPAAGFDLSDPGMLATLVTVLVSKHGGVRLSIEDFMLSDDAYVTVYVDPNSQEIVLSLNPNLGKEDIYSMASFVKSDDNTFH